MIALQAIPSEAPEPPARAVERGRTATRRRFRRAQRRTYAAFFRVSGAAVALMLPLMLYVMLTANLTSLNYKLARVQSEKAELLAQTMRQDDRIAKLESRERLAALAVRLHMHDPQVYAVVALPIAPPRPARTDGVAFLGAMNHWLSAAARDPRTP
jgi:hypothetical protein